MEVCGLWEVDVLSVEKELLVWVVALVLKLSGVVVRGSLVVSSILVGVAVPGVMDVEGNDNVCWTV